MINDQYPIEKFIGHLSLIIGHFIFIMLKKHWFILGLIVLVAIVLRFWHLGVVPPSPDWDEVALGYNAYSILHTGHDEYGKFLPVVLQSFDDYKPALYSYLIIPFIPLFDLSLTAVRFPSAVCGVITVIAVFFLVKDLFKRIEVAELVTFLLAISPWHIQFSRIAFETNVGLMCNVLTALFFVKGLKNKWLLFLVPVFSCAALYVYQSEKVFTPLFVLALVIIYRKQLFAIPKKYIAAVTLVGLLLIAPLVVYTVTHKDSFARAKGVSIFSQSSSILESSISRLTYDNDHHIVIGDLFDNRRVVYGKLILDNYLSHFTPDWLFITGDIPRHHAPFMGLLYLWEAPFILIGLYLLITGTFDKKTKALVFAWFFIAPIPASITTGVPHAVRTLNFLPTYQIFTAIGLIYGLEGLKIKTKNSTLIKIGIGILSLLAVGLVALNILYYLDQYFVQQNYYYSSEWQYGYEKLFPTIKKLAPKYKQIVVSNQSPMDQSYMFFLFYLKYDPVTYQKENKDYSAGFKQNHSFANFVFRPIDWTREKKDHATMYIGRFSDFPATENSRIDSSYLDGEPAMRIITP